MKPAVVLDERRMWWVGDNTYDLFYRIMWKGRVQPVQYGSEAALQDALSSVTTLARIVYLHAAPRGYTHRAEVYRSDIFNELFGGYGHRHSNSPSRSSFGTSTPVSSSNATSRYRSRSNA